MPDNLPESVQAPFTQTGTTATLVAAVAGSRIKITSLIISGSAAFTFNLQSHTTTGDKTGTVNASSASPVVLAYNPDGWFTSVRGEAVDLVTSTTASGSVQYVTD